MDAETSAKNAERLKFVPVDLRLLLIAESPPANPSTFFYYGTGDLFESTREALYGWLPVQQTEAKAFLHWVQDKGIFVEDLSHEPLNRLAKLTRKKKWRQAVSHLAARLQVMKRPRKVVICMKQIEPYVHQALQMAGWDDVPVKSLPFPGHWPSNRRRYVDGLREIWFEENPDSARICRS